MIKIIGCMLLGVLIGWILRAYPFKWVDHIITVVVWLLLFTLGIEIGGDENIISNLAHIGINAVTIAFLAMLGGILLNWGLWQLKKDKGDIYIVSKKSKSSFWTTHKSNIIVITIFGIGVLVGSSNWIDTFGESSASIVLLLLLMWLVGLNIGQNSSIVKQFKEMDQYALALPFVTIIGSWIGAIVAAFLLKETFSIVLAISSGLGYYSLSSIIITENLGAYFGAIAIVSNIIREITTIIFAPLIVRWFGPYALISSGGATTMDITLPFILKNAGEEFLVPSIYHGFITDLSVPFIVTLFCTLAL